jgi:uncharacterized protein YndB with AHSA1/START domain
LASTSPKATTNRKGASDERTIGGARHLCRGAQVRGVAERAFAAWADPKATARWFVGSDAHLELDFRVGGREHSRGSAPDGRAYSYEALYQDIVLAQRIVYTYDMLLQETRISVSLATVEFTPVGDNGTRLVFTEQGAFLDGHESPGRRAEGMGSLLDALDKELQSAAPGA